MPLDSEESKGTEKDGSKSPDYCHYCYQEGAFLNPDMTYSEMKELVKREMLKQKLPTHLIQMSMDTLPHLKRWKGDAHLL